MFFYFCTFIKSYFTKEKKITFSTRYSHNTMLAAHALLCVLAMCLLLTFCDRLCLIWNHDSNLTFTCSRRNMGAAIVGLFMIMLDSMLTYWLWIFIATDLDQVWSGVKGKFKSTYLHTNAFNHWAKEKVSMNLSHTQIYIPVNQNSCTKNIYATG